MRGGPLPTTDDHDVDPVSSHRVGVMRPVAVTGPEPRTGRQDRGELAPAAPAADHRDR
jgi:hypothetical protein